MNEWRKVPGFERYIINIDEKEGRCINTDWRGRERPIKTFKNRGWSFWTLCKDGKGYRRQAAVWIALTYPELVQNEWFEGAQIDHIDTDRQNNHPSNLRWVTAKENSNNPITKEHYRQGHIGLKHTPETRKKMSESAKKRYKK